VSRVARCIEGANGKHSARTDLFGVSIAASDAKLYPIYGPDYWATYFTDPDGIHLEVTNYRQERRERHDNW